MLSPKIIIFNKKKKAQTNTQKSIVLVYRHSEVSKKELN